MIHFSCFIDGVLLIFGHHLFHVPALFITLCCICGNTIAENFKTDTLTTGGLKKCMNEIYALSDSHDALFFVEPVHKNLTKTQPQQDVIDLGLNLEQQKLAQEHDHDVQNYNILLNQFYKSERIRIFNYTAFNSSDLKSRLGSGEFSVEGLQELTISFGYGMEFKINDRNRIGYEYLSSFPYDRGQLIRIFWLRNLKY